jgi:phosphoserine aminotransferase
MPATTTRIHNFSAGPAVLPVRVLEQVQSELLDYRGTGMSVLEMSHRSAAFEGIVSGVEADLRSLLGLTDEHAVLLLQGGASLQFAMVPMNLRPAGVSADYVVTGHWSKVALKEAEKLGPARVAGSSEAARFDRIPAAAEIQADPQAAYLHFTSNNTIYGTEWFGEPETAPGVPLVCDASSDFLSRPLPMSKYGLVYAGAQKNLGPAGVTVVVVRRDLLSRVPAGLPALLDYRLLDENKSLYNTPPCFAIYVVGLVLKWLRDAGGLTGIETVVIDKANRLYGAIDGSGGFYRGHAQPAARSRMNVTFRLRSEDLEKAFVKQATAEGLDGLKGHRSVGGLRASLYNALPVEAVQALVAFMQEFQRRNG